MGKWLLGAFPFPAVFSDSLEFSINKAEEKSPLSSYTDFPSRSVLQSSLLETSSIFKFTDSNNRAQTET